MRLRAEGTARPRRLAVLSVLAALATGGGLAACSTTVALTVRTSSTTTTTDPPPPAPAAPIRNDAVSLTTLPLVDTTRPVVGDGEVLADERDLPTTVWTPSGPGPFPLVVFVPGYDKGPLDYQRFCATLASAGYVVAAPSFPQEDPARGFPLDRTHLVDEAADVRFVITALEARPADDLDDARVAVVGHSDGADVALLVGYGTGTVDPRVGAVVADAPDPMTVAPVPSLVPLLLVQGTDDSVVPYSSSQTVFHQLDAPVFYLSLLGAGHLPPIAGGTPWTPVLDGAVALFLDTTVAGRGSGGTTLVAGLSASPLVRFASEG
jgi:dienelactone hydrolase